MRAFAIAMLMMLAMPAQAAVDQFAVLVVYDDVFRAMAGYSNTAGMDSITGGAPAATPQLDAIATAGFAHANIKTHSVCSPSRASLLDYGPTGNPANPYASAITPEDSDIATQIEPGYHNLVREAQADGWEVFFTGKLHLADYRFLTDGTTFVSQLGFNDAQFVSVGNPTNQLPGVSYATEDIGDVWDDCKGHNFHPVTDISGTVTFTRTHSAKGAWDAADAYMTAKSAGVGGKYLILIEPPPPHVPQLAGDPGVDDVNLKCNGDTEAQNDWPPGDSFTGGDDTDDVYVSNIEYNDTRLGELMADHYSDSYATHIAMVLTDNGTAAVQGVMPECTASPGMKRTPFVCGTTTHFVAAGPGIVANKHLTDRLNSINDVPATLLSLMGTNSIHSWGLNFSDCMTESNGQTAASCRHTRDSVTWAEWTEIGGAAGTIARPPRITDDADTWTGYEVASEVWFAGGEHVILHRVFDTTVSSMTSGESLYPIIHDGTAQELYSTSGVVWDTVASGEIAEDGTGWDITATDAAKAALVRAHWDLDHQWDRDGAPTPTFGGGSF